jgi:hypothetical protein
MKMKRAARGRSQACMSDERMIDHVIRMTYLGCPVNLHSDCLQNARKRSRKPYSLHIKHSHTTHTLNTTAYQPLSSPRASPATFTTSTANICDSRLTGSLDWAIYSADQHPPLISHSHRAYGNSNSTHTHEAAPRWRLLFSPRWWSHATHTFALNSQDPAGPGRRL